VSWDDAPSWNDHCDSWKYAVKLEGEGIPGGADYVWQPPFWLTGFEYPAKSHAVLWVIWMSWFEDRMDAKSRNYFKDVLITGTAIMRLP